VAHVLRLQHQRQKVVGAVPRAGRVVALCGSCSGVGWQVFYESRQAPHRYTAFGEQYGAQLQPVEALEVGL